MRRSVRVLSRAQQDIDSCYAYISKYSPQGAARWFNRLVEARESLATDAEMRPLAAENAHFEYEIRELFFGTRQGKAYRLLFTIVDDEVIVLRVRRPGQDHVSAAELPERPPPE